MKTFIEVVSPRFISLISKIGGIGKIDAITISPFIISDKKLAVGILQHEVIHVYQQQEINILMTLCICPLFYFVNFWILVPIIVCWLPFIGPFYILYFYFVARGFLKYKNFSTAYERIPMEQEAYQNEITQNYLANRKLFSWVKYKV